MVGVGKRFSCNFNCVGKIYLIIRYQYSDKFSDRQHGMRIVKLDYVKVRKIMEFSTVKFHMLFDQFPYRRRREEILLPKP